MYKMIYLYCHVFVSRNFYQYYIVPEIFLNAKTGGLDAFFPSALHQQSDKTSSHHTSSAQTLYLDSSIILNTLPLLQSDSEVVHQSHSQTYEVSLYLSSIPRRLRKK